MAGALALGLDGEGRSTAFRVPVALGLQELAAIGAQIVEGCGLKEQENRESKAAVAKMPPARSAAAAAPACSFNNCRTVGKQCFPRKTH